MSSRGLWSRDKSYAFVPEFPLKIALLSPTFATKHLFPKVIKTNNFYLNTTIINLNSISQWDLPTIRTTIAQEPALSTVPSFFYACFKYYASAASKPFNNASLGYLGKFSFLITN